MKKREKLAIIHKHYANATTTIDSVNRLIDFAEEILDLETGQVMLADSICSDDVNSIQYPARAREFLGPFKMGGLDGFPFAGLTGMGAFASHVPDNGAAFIYYGPHIGISKQGKLGEIHRVGQYKDSGCCGAAKGALGKLMNNLITENAPAELDYQMNTLEQILFKQKDRVLKAEFPLKEATEVIYEAIDERMNLLVEKTEFKCRYVILVGAILINSDDDIGSFTSAKRFDVIDVCNKSRKNYLNSFIS